MLTEGLDKTNAVDVSVLPPIQLLYFLRRYAPLDKQVAHAKRRQKVPGLAASFNTHA